MDQMLCALNDRDLEVELEFVYDDSEPADEKIDDLADPWFAEPDALVEAIEDDGSIKQPTFRMSVVLTAAAILFTAGVCFTL